MIQHMKISKIYQKKTTSDKVLHDTAFKTVSNQKYDGYQCVLASMVYRFFDKKAGVTSIHEVTGIFENQELANELHRPITR